MLFNTVLHHMDTFTIAVNIPDTTVKAALQLWNVQVKAY